MPTKVTDTILPTTMIGSYPKPRWFEDYNVAGADLRNVTIFAEAEVDRSPCGTGTCAVLAVLDAMGVVDEAHPFVHESIIGTTFSARVVERVKVGDYEAIVPELSGEAWITGEHTFVVQPGDSLGEGFKI